MGFIELIYKLMVTSGNGPEIKQNNFTMNAFMLGRNSTNSK
jgi:hypothetical protein